MNLVTHLNGRTPSRAWEIDRGEDRAKPRPSSDECMENILFVVSWAIFRFSSISSTAPKAKQNFIYDLFNTNYNMNYHSLDELS